MSRLSTGVGVMHVEVGHARDASAAPTRSLRLFARWFCALLADDGVSARFAAERQRDEGLVRRVERRHCP
jgi:hypothetical protein